MRSQDEIEKELMEVLIKKNYWKRRTEKLMDDDKDSAASYAEYSRWLSQYRALEYTLALRDSLTGIKK